MKEKCLPIRGRLFSHQRFLLVVRGEGVEQDIGEETRPGRKIHTLNSCQSVVVVDGGMGFSVCHCGSLHYTWLMESPAVELIETNYYYTVRCRYNTVHFLQYPHDRQTIARPLGRGMGCLLWVSSRIHGLLLSLQCRV